ncbi:mycofactocin biosynthesis glycosyltransferase MftF [Streptomyces sp. NPDC051921]|uniref:mycofactocin biosynthesis glycosyltransferase MftF n=1 Tax=Streptomyces sp. NPDC051921 TaxID=3155806 RepID=UPI003434A4C7
MTRLRLQPDPALRRHDRGRVLVGGSPLRVLRLTPAGAEAVDGWLRGEPVAPRHRRLAARLVRAGVVHPRYDAAPLATADVTLVVPVRDRPGPLPDIPGATRIVVDDGSTDPVPGATVRHDRAGGPAAARNSGWPLATTALVAFVDADVTLPDGWLEPLLPHFTDPTVAAVAPRVRSTPGPSLLSRYERGRGPLDLGAQAAQVRPGGRVAWVPTAALVVRTAALRALDGFDERLRFGEDVDLVWRLGAAGHQVRYEPASTVLHDPRTRWSAWLRQRVGYGTGAAPLALRHGRAAAPVRMSVWSAAAWAAAALGAPAAGAALATATAVLLPRTLRGTGVPAEESLRLAAGGHLGAGRQFADAVTRTWWPVAVPALLATRRGRWLLAAACTRHIDDWYRTRPPLDLPRWCLLRIADDLAYGAGVWRGAVRHRTLRPFLPAFTRRTAGGTRRDAP